MGNYFNKTLPENGENEKEDTKIETPINAAPVANDNKCTPVAPYKKLPIDPRSVTTGIDRTPIEVNCTPVGISKRSITAIPKHLQTKPYLETDLDRVLPQLTPKKKRIPKLKESQDLGTPISHKIEQSYLTPTVNVINNLKQITPIENERYKILGIDPRSPAANFDRTPILMPKSIDLLRARSQENLSRRGSYEMDICQSRFSYCETYTDYNVSEIQALPDIAQNAIRLLNLMNIGCEDQLNQSGSSYSSRDTTAETNSENEEQITFIANPKLNSKENVVDIHKSPIVTMKEKELENESKSKVVGTKQNNFNDDNDKIRVWRDSISSEEPDEVETIKLGDDDAEEETTQMKEEVIITFDDDSIVRDTLSSKIAKASTDYPRKAEIIAVKKKTAKPDMKMIANEKKLFVSEIKVGTEPAKIRTPLANRSNNGRMPSLLMTNSPQQLFRSKGITPKVYQENTPPHKMCIAKSKLSGMQWDPDSTVII